MMLQKLKIQDANIFIIQLSILISSYEPDLWV